MSELQDFDAAHMDVAQIDSLVAAAGPDGAREILEAFWSSTTSLLQSLEKELHDAAFDIAAQTAHAVKGSAANVGANRLSKRVAMIEIACREGNHQHALDSLPSASKDFEEFKVCFDEHISSQQA